MKGVNQGVKIFGMCHNTWKCRTMGRLPLLLSMLWVLAGNSQEPVLKKICYHKIICPWYVWVPNMVSNGDSNIGKNYLAKSICKFMGYFFLWCYYKVPPGIRTTQWKTGTMSHIWYAAQFQHYEIIYLIFFWL